MTEAVVERLGTIPPVLYVPIHEEVADPTQARVEYRATQDGRVAVLAYTALDRLIEGCGNGQPWILLPTPRFEEMRKVKHFDMVLVDIEMPDDLKRHAGGIG